MIGDTDPIAAVATGAGTSAVAIIRISGFDLLKLADKFVVAKKDGWQPGKFYLASIAYAGKVVDRSLVVYFAAPHSYTGQDVIEIHCHGGQYIRTKILTGLYDLGVRPAQPGEFTKRAFLYGKLDLAAAEGVAQLISAQTESQWQAAKNLAFGNVQKIIRQLRTSLLEAMALLNAALDFPDEKETQTSHRQSIYTAFTAADKKIAALIASYQQGRVATEGLRIALAGRPNVGKSSLLNILLAKDRAIVSDLPGTTRDYLEDTFLLEGRLFKIIDTAGIRSTADEIEQQGVEKTMDVIASCDLICHLQSVDEKDLTSDLPQSANQKVIPIMNKVDLAAKDTSFASDQLLISCKTRAGIPALQKRLVHEFDHLTPDLNSSPFINCERHYHALQQARSYLRQAMQGLDQRQGEECVAYEGQQAIARISEIIGEVTADDILDGIFSRFCLGK